MSYLVLARKSRPQNFEDVVGQQTVVRTLQNALTQHRVPHALIFSGVRGTGKTTLARIMAKALNCVDGPTATPCNQCRSCREITSGTSVDIQEVDGASNRGIQEIRELKERIRFMPTSSRYKVVIIDEVHMLTVEAFNALLKTLEEPPEHVYFLFATTELHKVPVTILSRCQRYELRRIRRKDLHAHSRHLAQGEGVEIDDQALDLVARESRGSVRDGLSLLDQLFSYCGDHVREKDVTSVLGLVGGRAVADLAEAVLAGTLDSIFTILSEVYRQGMNQRRLTGDLLAWFRALILCKVYKEPEQQLDLPEDDILRLKAQAAQHSLASLTGYFNLLLEGFERADRAGQQRLALEMVFIKAVQLSEVVPVSDLIGRLDGLLKGVDAAELPAPVTLAPPPIQPPAAAQIPPPKTVPVASAPPAFEKPAKPEPPIEQAPPSIKQAPPSKPESLEPAPEQGKGNLVAPSAKESDRGRIDIRARWDDFLRYVRERLPWVAAALGNAGKFYIDQGLLVIHFDEPADCRLLKNREYINPLTEFAMDFFQRDLSIRFVVPDSNACDVDPENGKSPQQERRALANDPLVLAAVEIFNGQVGDIRIGPKFRKSLPDPVTDQDSMIPEEE